ncbi:MAG: 5'/3'-nucleotidase SurE [Candidatus Heimdallarchaeota archaeon]
MPVILVTNDDGINAAGLQALIEELRHEVKILVVAPESQRSGESKALTFQAPLRAKKVNSDLSSIYAINGTPADAVVLGSHLAKRMFGQSPDLVVSGINAGDNTSIHAILTSGTCAAAFEAAIMGIPAVAFSRKVPPNEFFENGRINDFQVCAKRARTIVKKLLVKKLPSEVAFLNVNFPVEVSLSTSVLLTKISPIGYTVDVQEIRDPRGTSVYWVWGPMKEEFEPGTDIHTLLVENKISITPITLSLSAPPESITALGL